MYSQKNYGAAATALDEVIIAESTTFTVIMKIFRQLKERQIAKAYLKVTMSTMPIMLLVL